MKVINLTTTKGIKANFIILDSQVVGYYGFDHQQLEYRLLKDDNTKTLSIKDLNMNAHIQNAQYFFLEKQIQFVVAIRDDTGIKTILQVFNDKENFPLKLDRPIKGRITSIFIKHLNNYSILTVGTLDSALYVTRFTKEMKKTLPCALARTDARNSLAQEVIASDSPIVIVGGANGLLEFFLCKGPLDKEPQLEFLKVNMPELPSNLPILTLNSTKIENEHIITIGQDYLKKPKRPNASQNPSVSVIKFNEEVGEEIASKISNMGTTFSSLKTDYSPYQLWSCVPESNNIHEFKSIIHAWSLNNDTWKFELKSTRFVEQDIADPLKVYLTSATSCWVLSKDQLFFTDEAYERRGNKRRLSTDSQTEHERESKTMSKS